MLREQPLPQDLEGIFGVLLVLVVDDPRVHVHAREVWRAGAPLFLRDNLELFSIGRQPNLLENDRETR